MSVILGQNPIGLYLHWPFCARICPYCDFNVVRDRGHEAQKAALLSAMSKDIIAQGEKWGRRGLRTVYFGGGTPSLLPAQAIFDLLETAKNAFGGTAFEVTLELNPLDCTIDKLTGLKQAGVTRLSIGVQSFDEARLRFLGRDHSAKDAVSALEVARAQFDHLNIDLIYSCPDQSLEAWAGELKTAAAFGSDHISPYCLTIEEKTAFGRAARRGTLKPLDEGLGAAFFDTTQEVLGALGFEAYEVSNHAKGEDGRSQHNLHIWRGGDYVGVGPGAHGRLSTNEGRVATEALSDLRSYCAAIDQERLPYDATVLSPLEAEEERLMLGLRISEGVRVDQFHAIDLKRRALTLVDEGFMAFHEQNLFVTPKGRPLLDRLIYELLV